MAAPGSPSAAAATLEEAGVADPVLIVHGYHEDWATTSTACETHGRTSSWWGWASPNEMVWAHEWAPRIGRAWC